MDVMNYKIISSVLSTLKNFYGGSSLIFQDVDRHEFKLLNSRMLFSTPISHHIKLLPVTRISSYIS